MVSPPFRLQGGEREGVGVWGRDWGVLMARSQGFWAELFRPRRRDGLPELAFPNHALFPGGQLLQGRRLRQAFLLTNLLQRSDPAHSQTGAVVRMAALAVRRAGLAFGSAHCMRDAASPHQSPVLTSSEIGFDPSSTVHFRSP